MSFIVVLSCETQKECMSIRSVVEPGLLLPLPVTPGLIDALLGVGVLDLCVVHFLFQILHSSELLNGSLLYAECFMLCRIEDCFPFLSMVVSSLWNPCKGIRFLSARRVEPDEGFPS